MMKRKAGQIGVSLCQQIVKIVKPDMRTLECGSGLSTWLFFGLGCDHIALEHERKYAPPLSCVHLVPLSGTPLWYDWVPTGRPFDFILVDGPPAKIGRFGIMRVLDKITHPGTTFLIDDTNRKKDDRLAYEIATQLNLERIVIQPSHKFDFRKKCSLLVPKDQKQNLSLITTSPHSRPPSRYVPPIKSVVYNDPFGET